MSETLVWGTTQCFVTVHVNRTPTLTLRDWMESSQIELIWVDITLKFWEF